MNFLRDELIHLIIALAITGVFYFKNRDWRLILAGLLFGFFIDLDHLFDYLAYFGLRLNLADFLDVTTYMRPAGKVYILFHGWEFLPLLWFLGRWTGKRLKIKTLEWVISLTYLGHLFWDNLTVSAHPLAYSFIYRLLNSFNLENFNGF